MLAKGYLVALEPRRRVVAGQPLDRLHRPSATSFRNIYAVPAAGGDEPRLTAMPNGNANNISWSPDGTFIIFNTNQRPKPGEAVRVDLMLKTPRFREDRFRDLFKDEPPRPPAGERRASAGDDQPRAADSAGGHRVRRHPSRLSASAGRRGRQCADDQPRWPIAAADGDGGGSTEPVCLFARRAVARAGGGPPADIDRRREGGRAVHAR